MKIPTHNTFAAAANLATQLYEAGYEAQDIVTELCNRADEIQYGWTGRTTPFITPELVSSPDTA